tara:strand:- start:179 stop:520 length:342 start_codon:yes stop_codon:yes gene_type:complete
MNKRGLGEAQQLFLFFEIIIGLAVAGIFVFTAIDFDSISNVNKIYTEEDLNILTPTLLAAPGEIEYNYPLKSSYEITSTDPFQIEKSLTLTKGFSYYNLTLTKEEHATQLQAS